MKVKSFTERKLYTWCFLIVGLIAPVYLSRSIAWKSGTPLFMWLSCWFLSVFTLMPAEIPDNTLLVQVTEEVNTRVEDATKGLLKELLPQEAVTPCLYLQMSFTSKMHGTKSLI